MAGLDRDQCVAACRECSRVCEETAHHCHCVERTGAGGRELVRSLVACAAILRYLSELLDDDYLVDVANFFADACARCAADCAGAGVDPELRRCADCCERCARCVRELAALVEPT